MSKKGQSDQLIRLASVSRHYPTADGRFYALQRVTLELPAGEFIGVVGRSGSGKSTLVNLIAGLDRPSEGQIWVAGNEVSAMSEDELSLFRGGHVGVVFQFFQLLPTLTVLENVLLPMDFSGTLSPADARRRGLELLSRVGIVDQAGKLPFALSGGQQQRAAIARALANDPKLVVADEPTGNLDVDSANLVLDLLAELAREGRTVLLVTHERDVSSRVDRIVNLSDGHVVSVAENSLKSATTVAPTQASEAASAGVTRA
jgi:putative ABC transport system ATP-binding protein